MAWSGRNRDYFNDAFLEMCADDQENEGSSVGSSISAFVSCLSHSDFSEMENSVSS